MSNKEQNSRSALDHLMLSAKRIKKKRRIVDSPDNEKSAFFPCPAGCGQHVSEREVNVHLDEFCSVMGRKSSSSAPSSSLQLKTSSDNLTAERQQQEKLFQMEPDDEQDYSTANTSILPQKPNHQSPHSNSKPRITIQKTPPKKVSHEQNAFSHMMKQSAKAFNVSENIVKHKFHLHHDRDGKLATTWISDQSDAIITMDEAVWSATVSIKKIKPVLLNQNENISKESTDDKKQVATKLELEVSSSIPFQQSKATNQDTSKPFSFVQQHSRLSVPHLKSILQKSIRRRAPLPSVRVAMELADRSFSDLIRRLPIIILEDSFLHDDFDFLVWLMVAESKGYVPSASLMVRVIQIVFEMASCPRRDERSEQVENCQGDGTVLSSFSLTTPTSNLFPDNRLMAQHSIANKCETLIRAMLLRAQYGGMACDVTMLHFYSSLWLKRYQSQDLVPIEVVSSLPTSKIFNYDQKAIQMRDIPRILHGPSREKSEELITHQLVAPGGLAKLTEADVCVAGIDFHCSPVVENLLSRTHVYASLCEKLSSNDREWIISQVKSCIWTYSSGVNRRRTLVERLDETTPSEEKLKVVWETILKPSFDDFTKKFVRQRLA